MLMKMMVEYCQCVDNIPSAAPDLMSRLVDLFKVGHLLTNQREVKMSWGHISDIKVNDLNSILPFNHLSML